MDRGGWWAAVHGVAKSRTRLSDFTFIFHFPALEKEMATHSSILAWRIPRDRRAWWAVVCGVAQSRTRLRWLSSSSIADLQCCVSFCCTAKWFSYTHMYIYTHTHFSIVFSFIAGSQREGIPPVTRSCGRALMARLIRPQVFPLEFPEHPPPQK